HFMPGKGLFYSDSRGVGAYHRCCCGLCFGATRPGMAGGFVAHIIVVGNEKGGSGKSTTSMHVATALARMGHRVGALDLDVRQRSFGRYLENRAAFLQREGLDLPMPLLGELGEGSDPLTPALHALEVAGDFIRLDCPC